MNKKLIFPSIVISVILIVGFGLRFSGNELASTIGLWMGLVASILLLITYVVKICFENKKKKKRQNIAQIMKYDVKARIINLRKNGNHFSSKYRPAFQILDDYATSGEIELIDTDKVEVGEWTEAYISFLTPEVYPHSVWVGREIEFKEGLTVTGKAIILEVYNETLLKQS